MKPISLYCLFSLLSSNIIHAATASWASAVSGDWLTAANWTPAAYPTGNTEDATIAITGAAYTITGTPAEIRNLTISSANATLLHNAGAFTVATANVSAGTVNVSNATLQGGAWSFTGSSALNFTGTSAISNNVSLAGNWQVNGSLTVNTGASWTGVGKITNSSSLQFTESRTLSTGTVEMADTSFISLGSSLSNTPLSLTLAPATLIHGKGTITRLGTGARSLTSQGEIRADTSSPLTLNQFDSLTNSGTLSSTVATATLNVTSIPFTNTGLVRCDAGIININPLNDKISNNTGGTIRTTSSTATINYGGTMTTAQLGLLDNTAGGILRLAGVIDNTSATLNINASTGNLILSGTINGGTIQPSGSNYLRFQGTAGTTPGLLENNAIYNGDLFLDLGNLKLDTGATWSGSNATISASCALTIQDTRTLSGKNISLSTPSNAAYISIGKGSNTLSLTLDSTCDVHGRGIINEVSGTTTLNNEGLIRTEYASSMLSILNHDFINNSGIIRATVSGAQLRLNPTGTLTNTGLLEAVNSGQLLILHTGASSSGGILNNQLGEIRCTSADASVTIGGTMNTRHMGIMNNTIGGKIYLSGLMYNSVSTMTASSSTGELTVRGIIDGGDIFELNGQQFRFDGGTIRNNALFQGDLSLSGENLILDTGATWTGANATLTNNGSTSSLTYLDDRVISGKNITLGTGTYLLLGANVDLELDSISTIHGAGTITNSPGSGSRTFINHGTVQAEGPALSTLTIGVPVSNYGTITTDGFASCHVGTAFTQYNGILRTNRYNTLTNICGAGTANITAGRVESSGRWSGSITMNGGTFSPTFATASSAAYLVVDNDLTLTNSATTELHLGGLTAGTQYDQIRENGATPLTLSGTLNLSFINGFDCAVVPANTFTIITSNQNITGMFSNVSGGRIATSDGFGDFAIALSADQRSVILSDWHPSGTTQDLISDWRFAHFGTYSNSGNAADDADPDYDGIANLVEYALELTPTSLDTEILWLDFSPSATQPRININVPNNQRAAVTLYLDSSTTLSSWTTIAQRHCVTGWTGSSSFSSENLSPQSLVRTRQHITPNFQTTTPGRAKNFFRLRATTP